MAIANDLTEDGFVLRYRTDETDDGLTGKEGTFLICSFWLVTALALVGELQQARDLMERLLRVASPLGLYAEEFDAGTGRHLGNFPQAFSHLALMEAAAHDHPPRDAGGLTWSPTTSSSSAPAPAAARSPATWPRRASASWCSSAATGSRASRRTGWPRTCSSTTGTSRPTPGTTGTGKPFQPQIHYFVGGATKLYGAALYRLRARGLRRAPPSRRRLAGMADLLRRARAVLHDGRAGVRGARRPRRGSHRAARERAVPVPGGVARAADPALSDDLAAAGLPPVPRTVRDPAERGGHAPQRLRPLPELRRLPVRGARQVGRRGARHPARARASQRHPAHERRPRRRSRRTPSGTAVTEVVVRAERLDRDGSRAS